MYLSLTDYIRDCRKSLFLKFFSFRALVHGLMVF